MSNYTHPTRTELLAGGGTLGSDDHAQLHENLGHEIETLGYATHLYARDFGLGDGTTADGTALAGMFTEAQTAFVEPDLDRGSVGGILEIPAGIWTCQDSGGALVRLPMVAPGGSGGDIHLFGQGRGVTTLKVPTNCGYGTLTCVGAARSGNVVTVQTSAAHGLAEGDVVTILMYSRAIGTWNHVTVIDGGIVDTTHFKYAFGTSGTATDAIKPGTSGPSATIHKIGGLILPFNFSQTRRFWLHNMTIDLKPPGAAGGFGEDGATAAHANNPWSPQRGFALLANARVNCFNVEFMNAWGGTLACGSALGTMMTAAGASPSAQNTDHYYMFRCSWINNRSHKIFVSNSGTSQSTVGGTRDFTYRDCNSGTSFHSDFCVGDDASLFVLSNDVYHGKSSPFPIYGEGIQGVTPQENLLIDILIGSMKFESPGNVAMIWDESRRRSIQKMDACQIRSEVSVNINGNNNANDTTYKPWAVSTSIAVSPNVQTVTGLPTGHQLRVGDPIYIGLPADRSSALNVGGIVKTTAANTVTFDRPDYTAGAISATAAIAGTGGGVRVGLWDISRPKLSIDQSGSSKMSKAAFVWDFQYPPNLCTFEASVEQNQNGDGVVPSVQCESEAPAGVPSRSIWIRGSRVFELMFHDVADGFDITPGDLVELRAAHRVWRSTATRVHILVGVAQQYSDDAAAIIALAVGSGTGGATPGRIHVYREHLWVALPGSVLTRSDASAGLNVSGSAADGDPMFDNGDGKVAKWNGTDTGKRLVGQLIEAPVSTTAGMRTMPESWT